MHDDELFVDEEIVRDLVAEQFPPWRQLPIRRVVSDGTVNAIFRIGDGHAARFRLTRADPAELTAELATECAAMSELAASCSVPTPVPVALGAPGRGYPQPWSVQTWLRGSTATATGLADSALFTEDLIRLVNSLRRANTAGRQFTGAGRGGDLRDSNEWMETCFRQSDALLPIAELRRLWSRLIALPSSGPDVMTHGDLIPGNLLVDGERLVGVLDGGGFAAADPALDLVVAWHLLDADARRMFRGGLDVSMVQWWRGAAWAFQQTMGLVWYYRDSNPGMSELGRSTLGRILADPEIGVGAAPTMPPV